MNYDIIESPDERVLLAELAHLKRLITEIHPTGVISSVSDTYDYWGVINQVLPRLKNEIMAREGKVVIRPDSGDPVEIICGMEIATIDDVSLDVEGAKSWVLSEIIDQVQEETPHGEYGGDVHEKYVRWGDKVYLAKAYLEWNRYDKQFYYIDHSYSKITSFEEVQLTPEQKGSIECLWETFGGTMSSTGYKVLDSHIGLIYGDSITPQRAWEILRRLEDKGFASTNVVFGIGSYTYQLVTRDTHGFAVKATWAQIDGVRNDIYKSPKTDPGKKSLKGRFDVQLNEETGNLLVTLEDAPGKSQYITYFNNGKYTDRLFSDVRKNVEKSLSHIEVKKPK